MKPANCPKHLWRFAYSQKDEANKRVYRCSVCKVLEERHAD